MLIDIKMKKKTVAELGYNGRLNVYVNSKKFTSTLAFKPISPKWLSIFGHRLRVSYCHWPPLL